MSPRVALLVLVLPAVLLLVVACGGPPAPSAPAGTFAIAAEECARTETSREAIDACRARAQQRLCDAEPALCDAGVHE